MSRDADATTPGAADEIATTPKGDPIRLAVVAHRRKTFGPGLPAMRHQIADTPYGGDLWWSEVDKSKKVVREVHRALAAGATLVLLPDGPQSLPELLAADPAITGNLMKVTVRQWLIGLMRAY